MQRGLRRAGRRPELHARLSLRLRADAARSAAARPPCPGKGTALLEDKSPDKRDALNWKYIKGAATTLADFGDPLTATDYTLCIYDSSAASAADLFARAPAGGTCGTKPCWKTIKGGFKYNDKLFTPDGLQQVLLKSGAATKTKILVKGKGVDLPMPTLPLTPMVTVQLKSESGVSLGRPATRPPRRTYRLSTAPKRTDRRPGAPRARDHGARPRGLRHVQHLAEPRTRSGDRG